MKSSDFCFSSYQLQKPSLTYINTYLSAEVNTWSGGLPAWLRSQHIALQWHLVLFIRSPWLKGSKYQKPTMGGGEEQLEIIVESIK